MIEKIDVRIGKIIRVFPSAKIKIIVETPSDPKSLEKLVESAGGQYLHNALKYIAVKIQAGLIKNLVKDPRITKIWYVDSRIFEPYVGALGSVEWLLGRKDKVGAVNFSLAPPIEKPGTQPFDPNEPFNVATKKLFEAGFVPVVAAGNAGALGNDTLNPWSVAPWVIGVGATTIDGKKLADFSSRGIPGDPLYKPTVVGPGVDIVVPHPPEIKKTPEQIEKDRQFLSEDQMSSHTVVTGTSFAAANISGGISNIMSYLSNNFGPKMSEDVTWYHFDPRKIEVKYRFGNYDKTIRFEANSNSLLPSRIKELIIQMAMPMPGYEPHEVGAGFMNRAVTETVFGKNKVELGGTNILRDEPW